MRSPHPSRKDAVGRTHTVVQLSQITKGTKVVVVGNPRTGLLSRIDGSFIGMDVVQNTLTVATHDARSDQVPIPINCVASVWKTAYGFGIGVRGSFMQDPKTNEHFFCPFLT